MELSEQEFQQRIAMIAPALERRIAARIPRGLRRILAAEDVLQDAWIDAFRNRKSFYADRPHAFERWISTLVDAKLADALRRAGRLKRGGGARRAADVFRSSYSGLFDRLLRHENTPSREMSAAESAALVQIALARLPADRRRAIELRYVQGLARGAIARELGRATADVGNLLYQGLCELRGYLRSACTPRHET